MSGCNTGCSRSFGKHNKMAAKAMKLKHKEGISLKEAWAKVRGFKKVKKVFRLKKKSRRSKRRSGRKSRRSKRRSGRKSRRSKRRSGRKSRRSKRRSGRKSRRGRRFGEVMGPGYAGQTSFPNVYAPYFGASEPFVNASNWWYPRPNGVAQSPQMLMKSPLPGYNGPAN